MRGGIGTATDTDTIGSEEVADDASEGSVDTVGTLLDLRERLELRLFFGVLGLEENSLVWVDSDLLNEQYKQTYLLNRVCSITRIL